jgi:hypothetical protein
MRLEDSWIYILTSFTALTAPTVNPFHQWTPNPLLLDTFLAGTFYAMKAVYLLKLNLANFRFPKELETPATSTKSSTPQSLITPPAMCGG